jgi:hypothetical protein
MHVADRNNQIEIGERWRKYLDAIDYDSSKLNSWQLYNLGGNTVMKHAAVQEAALAAAAALQEAYPYASIKLDTLLAAQRLPAATKAEIRAAVETAKAMLPACHF